MLTLTKRGGSAAWPDSACWRRFLLQYGYNPLALATPGRNHTWNVPKSNLIEFGIVFEV